ADPRVVADAVKISDISFPDMLALSSNGAGVLAVHSVELAMANEIPISVRSSFNFEPGTLVGGASSSVGVVGVAGRSSDEGGLVTVVGRGDFADLSRRFLTSGGFEFDVVGTGDNWVTFLVGHDVRENVTRHLHTSLGLGLEGESDGS
ncbi:MAG TPA: hypothetical protein VIW94_10910, partial [Acidimicrobiia bacterium]